MCSSSLTLFDVVEIEPARGEIADVQLQNRLLQVTSVPETVPSATKDQRRGQRLHRPPKYLWMKPLYRPVSGKE